MGDFRVPLASVILINKKCPVEGPGTLKRERNAECGIDFANLAVIVIIPLLDRASVMLRNDVRCMALRPRLSTGLLLSVSTLVTFNERNLIMRLAVGVNSC